MSFRLYTYLLFLMGLMLSSCQTANTPYIHNGPSNLQMVGQRNLCNLATRAGSWETRPGWSRYVTEAKSRGLNCGVNKASTRQSASASEHISQIGDRKLCIYAVTPTYTGWNTHPDLLPYVVEAKRRGLSCFGAASKNTVRIELDKELPNSLSDGDLCKKSSVRIGKKVFWVGGNSYQKYVQEAKSRGLECEVTSSTEILSTPIPVPKPISAELIASQRKTKQLEAELAALKAQQAEISSKITSDTQLPLITITSSLADNRLGSIMGNATDNIGIAEVRVDEAAVPLKPDGRFEWQGFVPPGGKSVVIEAIDTAGLSSMQEVRLERGKGHKSSGPTFAQLDPFRGKTAKKNRNALALIVGVSNYERTPDPATFADKDAEYFQDYAAIKLGVPDNNIFTMINQDADRIEIKKAVKNWLLRMSEKDKTDVYVFFAGHGLTSRDGKNMFLIPYDGDPELLEDSAIDRKQLFSDIQAISPRSVTVFLDSCYSGGTRAGGTLVASLRTMVYYPLEQNIPDGFTVLSAAKGDQTSQSLEEAQHGLFSYFLMRGLEGDADANNDNQITNGELHEFVTEKVERQSGFKQTPDLQGDRERVLVRFE